MPILGPTGPGSGAGSGSATGINVQRLVGDVIISARELIPDMPQVLPPPSNAQASLVASSGSTLPAGTYFCVVSFITPWGETTPSPESIALVVGANQGIQVNPVMPPSAIGVRAYLTLPGGASGTEQQFIQSSTVPFTISAPPSSTGLPATRNSAYLADTDGLRMFSASTLYRWLNEGMRRLARKVGGIQDYSAVGSVSGQSLYVLAGEWSKIDSVWYDGFPLGLGNQGGFFRRNQIRSSVLASAAISIRTNQVVMEVFYQPIRTAGASTLSSAMAITDTVAAITSLANFTAFGPPMFALIGSEIVALSAFSGSSLIGLIRGVGGTVPQAWPIGTAVQELNIPLLGKRLHTQQYTPGNAANMLPVPIGWESILPTYILSKARTAEQDTQTASALLKEFDDAALEMLRANRQIMGPTQVGGGMYGAETVPGFGSYLGGVVLP